MARKQKVKIVFFILMIGLVLAFMVLAEAFNATIQHENNEYSKTNADIQGEIDTLKVKVKSSNNIENIEKVAIEDLGMVYPGDEQCVYLTEDDKPKGGFAAMLKSQAYN